MPHKQKDGSKTRYSLGLDFGTNSCRCLIVDLSSGREVSSSVFPYPSGEAGIITDPKNPLLARQNPMDYIDGLRVSVKKSLSQAKAVEKEFSAADVIGIGIDTTGSSPMPVDKNGQPLCFQEEFRNNPQAMVWLWKDHTSYAEAEEITSLAKKMRPEFLAKIGGAYSSEWFWSKILHCRRASAETFNAAFAFMEICDYIPGLLCGETRPSHIKASVCAAGHKALYSKQWNGLPDKEYLQTLSPGLEKLRDRLYRDAFSADRPAGYLTAEWAAELGLPPNTAIAVGALDAHMGAVGAGVKPGTLVKILGTSTCDVMVSPLEKSLADIAGVCGIVEGSVIGGFYGIEAGQSAVGDIFLWFVNHLVPENYGTTKEKKFKNLEKEAARLSPGESGLLALDWNNGNRNILADHRLTGMLLGQTLHTRAHEIYRALIEATAFGALTIIDRIEAFGVSIQEIVNCGGLASRNPLLMQIYADICGRPMKVSRSGETPALGAAIFGCVAAGEDRGGYNNVPEAQKSMTGISQTYTPDPACSKVYKKLYGLYKQLHDGFGIKSRKENMYPVMKQLLAIRDKARLGKGR
jgi:L-ribulokinase